MVKKLPNKQSIVLLSLLCVVATAFPGCKKPEQVTPKPVQSPPPVVAPKPVQPQNSSVKTSGPTEPQFDFSNRKDPFKPVIAQQQAVRTVPQRAVGADMLPIQSYDTTKFRVSGIIAGLKENKALIIDPAGKGYVVKQGMPIGSNDGIISKISASSVEVIESYREDNGRIRKRTIKLTLPQKR